MKKINMLILTAAVVMMGSLSSCKKEKNDPDPREAFVGEYEMSLACDQGIEDEGEQTVSKSTSNEREIVFEEFLDLGEDVRAEVTGTTFTLKKTTVMLPDGDGGEIEADLTGTGSLNGKTLTVDFKLKGPGGTLNCEAEGDKN